MFGRSRPVVFNPYGRRRSRWRLPRWLVLLLVGGVLGALAVVLVQERYLPPRLSAAQSNQLRGELDGARAESTRMHDALAQATARMNAALSERAQLQTALADSRASAESAREVASSLVAALPPDPRGGAIEVRAARFEPKGGELGYDIVLTRARPRGANAAAAAKPMPAVLQIAVAGANARGAEATFAAPVVELAVGEQQSVRGKFELPSGFKARESTITLMDRVGGKRLGMRVIRVEG
jgi:hypothetical protein